MRYALTIHLGMGGASGADDKDVAAPLAVVIGDDLDTLENFGTNVREMLATREKRYGQTMFHDDLFSLVTAVDDMTSADEIAERIWQQFGAPTQPTWRLSDG